MDTFSVRTGSRSDMVDITRKVAGVVEDSGATSGVCVVYVPHTTAGVTINEAADPDVARDIISALDKLVPWRDNYAHAEGNSAAHLKASLIGSSLSVPFENGRLQLGTWQGVFFCEYDGPRNRNVHVSVVAAS